MTNTKLWKILFQNLKNLQRTGKDKVPDVAIYSKAKIFEEPSIDEGFDEIQIVKTSEVSK